MNTTLAFLNTCDAQVFAETLNGIYEHSPWIAQRAAGSRPFASIAALKLALQRVVSDADTAEQLDLIRAHPELAGKAAKAGTLTRESTGEQASAGLHACSAEEFDTLHRLNASYNEKFGFPFILAIKGPTGSGMTRQQIIAAFTRRLQQPRQDELAESLRQIGRIAELRLNDLLGYAPRLGNMVMAWSETLSAWSDDDGMLTCAYLTDAHRRTAAQIARWMREAGMHVHIDAVGNVVGRHASDTPGAKTLMTGSHYDTVRNGGKYDGREGILLPIAVIGHLREQGIKLPFHVDVIAFAEEEGVRFKSTFLGSSAIVGQFDPALLEKIDADCVTMREAITAAGHDVSAIAACARDPAELLGFIEVHIEQGPVLLDHDLPVGIVSAIAGSCRYLIDLTGVASHAGTTPMSMRRDAAAAAAEIVLYVERRCRDAGSLVGTVGQLQVPNGSVNVIPGACTLSLDLRAADDPTRDAAVTDVMNEISAICKRRNIGLSVEQLMKAAAAPCAGRLSAQLSQAVARQGIAPFTLLSGAGHDAMMMARMTDVCMLFTRCGNGGISHNPQETMTADDAQVSADVLIDFLLNFESGQA